MIFPHVARCQCGSCLVAEDNRIEREQKEQFEAECRKEEAERAHFEMLCHRAVYGIGRRYRAA